MKKLSYVFYLVLATLLTSCGTTHIEFTINWAEVFKVIGLIALGAFIVIVIIAYLFRDFRIW